jgi:glutaminase
MGGYDLPASPWRNPYTVKRYGRERAVELYREHILNSEELLSRLGELEGKTLACWCRPDEPCHGDVLLELLAQRG